MTNKCCNTVAMLAFVATTAAAQRPSPIPVDTAAMDAHLRFLASDLLEGRAPATRGGRLAAEYIAAQFQALGLQPAGANGTYFQPVALVGMTPEPRSHGGRLAEPPTRLPIGTRSSRGENGRKPISPRAARSCSSDTESAPPSGNGMTTRALICAAKCC